MDKARHDRDRVVCSSSVLDAGERPDKPDVLTEQPLPPKDERIVSANTSPPEALIIGHSSNVTGQRDSLDAGGGDYGTFHHYKAYVSSNEQNISYAGGSGYGSSTGSWNAYSQYVNSDGLHVLSPVVYNDNSSLVFHSGYGFNPEIAYGQYSPVATPMPLMVDGQLFSPQQLPFSPSYFHQTAPNLPHMSSALQVSPTELMTPESSTIDNMFFGPGSGYLVNFGSLGGGNLSGNVNNSPVTSPTVYHQPMGILGSYENNFGQISQQQRPTHGYGLAPGSHYHHGSSYQSSGYGGASFPYSVTNDLNQLTLDKGRRRERDQDSISVSIDSRDIFNDRNRGPRASKQKGKSGTEQGSSSGANNNNLSASGILLDSYNRLDFVTDYENAKFFIIKSFSEDNVHKSIKYNVWASTPHGNKKLDVAYHEARDIKSHCPVFLFFSVNASGQFCGVAEMVGAVDFERDADYWQQDRWSGQFPVQWHIVKDVPNIRFRHILLDNNDNKPVTHSRDSQEVGFKQGIEMLKIFKDHDARTSLLDDFYFYDDREKVSRERKARHQACSTSDGADSFNDSFVHDVSTAFSQALNLRESANQAAASEVGASTRKDVSESFGHDSLNQLSGVLSQGLGKEEGDKEVLASGSGGDESIDKEATVK
ncbi:YTH domain-containing protein ECT4-like isoform X2 [Humulus lupulus]|uniref:YTH domain-containing protein ECT4-like isoform X2 n=1 Tax=Humulus lupulus TaxID=3486 RepID=UPI002B417540|nr:YTH domain-containing protein ECT4-like isoform X2 [Humulus lupulus]